jgi:hypothetical protein
MPVEKLRPPEKIRGAISLANATPLRTTTKPTGQLVATSPGVTLSPEAFARLRRLGWLPPMAGGAPDDDEGDDTAETDGDANDAEPADDGHVRVSKADRDAELERVRAANAILAKERKAEDKRRQEAGKHDEVLAERDREHTEALEQRDARIAELEGEAQHRVQRDIAERVAKRLEFRDPEDLWLRVQGSDRASDEKGMETRGKQILKDRPDLRAGQAATSVALNGASSTDVTPEQAHNELLTAMLSGQPVGQ